MYLVSRNGQVLSYGEILARINMLETDNFHLHGVPKDNWIAFGFSNSRKKLTTRGKM